MEYITNLPMDFWITLATMIITLILGQLTKKFTNINKKKIPIQNMFIGLFVFVVEWIITKELSVAIALSGIFSGGIYDLGKAFMQLVNKEEE